MPDLSHEQFLTENPAKIDKQKIVDAIYNTPKQFTQVKETPLILLYDLWD